MYVSIRKNYFLEYNFSSEFAGFTVEQNSHVAFYKMDIFQFTVKREITL